MTGILADADAIGYVDLLVHICQHSDWQAEWSSLNLLVHTFEDIGLPVNAPDSLIWQTCQHHQLVLITRNRNAKGRDSLEATMRAHNSPECLPVLTLANADRIRASRDYAERVVERMLEFLMDIDKLRGTGRLYLP